MKTTLFFENFRMAISSVMGNKTRAALTMLGILIGVGSVVSLTAVGKGAQNTVSEKLQSLGSNLLMVNAGQKKGTSLVRTTPSSPFNLTDEDWDFVQTLGPKGLKTSAMELSSYNQIKYLSTNANVSIVGTIDTYAGIRKLDVDQGRFITEQDNENRNRIVVLGATAATNLFAEDSPLGKNLRIRNISFEVVGVLASKGSYSSDNTAYLPVKTFKRYLYSTPYYNSFSLQAESKEVMTSLQTELESGLLKIHKCSSMDDADFTVANQQDIIKTLEGTTATFTLMLAGIAAISLLVGGIGVMNIQLVQVSERTREIGLRMAVGAQPRDILVQFLTEAVVLSLIGGLIGLILGIGAAIGMSLWAGISTSVTWESAILALSFSSLTGLFFGAWPAWRASKLDPIEALRQE